MDLLIRTVGKHPTENTFGLCSPVKKNVHDALSKDVFRRIISIGRTVHNMFKTKTIFLNFSVFAKFCNNKGRNSHVIVVQEYSTCVDTE